MRFCKSIFTLERLTHKSKQIAQQQVQASTFNKSFTRIAHYFTHLLSMAGPVAVDWAVFAGYFFFQRTFQAACKGIGEELSTFGTISETLQRGELKYELVQLVMLLSVVSLTID